MAAPLIVNTGRVTRGPARNSRQPAKVPTQRRNPQSEGSSAGASQPTPSQRPLPRYASPKQMLRRSALPQASGIEDRIMAYSAASFILTCTLPLYAPQIFFFMFGLAGLGLETIPYLDWIMPGIEVFFIGWMMTLLIGVGSMLFAAFTFSMRGVDAFGNSKTLIFICCLIAYLSLFLSIIPWVAIWTLYVAYNFQDKDTA